MTNTASTETSPAAVLWQRVAYPGFRQLHLPVLAVGVLAVVATLLLGPALYQGQSIRWTVFAASIQLLGVWGFWRAFRLLLDFDEEIARAEQVRDDGGQHLDAIVNSRGRQPQLSDLQKEFGQGEETSTTTRMCQRILREAADHTFSSLAELVGPFKEATTERTALLKQIQVAALRLGVLGTFVGLLLAIVKMGSVMRDVAANASAGGEAAEATALLMSGSAEILQLFEHVFGALRVSFGTSVAGLQVAVVLGFLIMIVRKRQENYFLTLEDAAGVMIALGRNAELSDTLFVELAQVRESVRRVENQITRQADGVADLVSRVEGHTSAVDRGVVVLDQFRGRWFTVLRDLASSEQRLRKLVSDGHHTTQQQFDDNMRELARKHTEMLEELIRVSDAVEFGKLAEDLKQSVAAAGRDVGEQIKPAVKELTDGIVQTTGAVARVDSTNARVAGELQGLSSTWNSVGNRLGTRVRSLESEVNKLTDTNSKLLQRLDAFESGMAEVVTDATKQLSQTVRGFRSTAHAVMYWIGVIALLAFGIFGYAIAWNAIWGS